MPINHQEHCVYGEGLTRTASGEILVSVQRLAKEVGATDEEIRAALKGGLLSARRIRDFGGHSVEAINLESARLHFNLSEPMTQRLYRPTAEDLSIERLAALWPESGCRPAAKSTQVATGEAAGAARRPAKLHASRTEPVTAGRRPAAGGPRV